MKKSLILLLGAFCTFSAMANAMGFPTRYAATVASPIDSSFLAIPSTQELFSEILTTMSLDNSFELKSADVMNLEASISHRKKLVLYNPEFVTWINKATGNKWGTLALLAHEIGHHVDGHTRHHSGSSPEIELEADEYAGYVLQKMGATLPDAQEVMVFIAGNQPTHTHPARSDRMQAIRNGWNRAFDEAQRRPAQ